MLNRVDGMQKTLAAFQGMVRSSDDNDLKKKFQPLMGKSAQLGRKLRELKDSVYNSELQPGAEDDIHYLAAFSSKLSELGGFGGFGYGEPPTQLALDQKAELTKESGAAPGRVQQAYSNRRGGLQQRRLRSRRTHALCGRSHLGEDDSRGTLNSKLG